MRSSLGAEMRRQGWAGVAHSWGLVVTSLLAGMVALAACSSTDEEEPPPDYSADDLPLMVLTRAELGMESVDLQVSGATSGWQDAVAVADNSLDPDDTAADIERWGLLSDYDLDYEPSSPETADGLVLIGTSVALWRTDEDAREYIERTKRDLERFLGQDLDGVILKERTTFAVSVGDQSGGERYRIGFKGEPDHFQTVVYFREDRITASAFVLRQDDRRTSDDVKEMAQRLQDRVDAVRRGEVTGTAVPLPQVTSAAPDASWKKFQAEGIEIQLPATFEGGRPTSQDIDAIAERLATLGADYEPMVQMLRKSPPPFVLWMFDANVGPSGAITNVNVGKEAMPSGVSIGAYLDATRAQLPSDARVSRREVVALERFPEAGRLVVEAQVLGTGTVIYVLRHGSEIWIVGYTTHVTELEQRMPDFERSIATFRVNID